MYDFEIKQVLAKISSTEHTEKLLTVTAWNGGREKMDLRTWRDTEDGRQPGRGVTLTEQEAAALFFALAEHFKANENAGEPDPV